MTENVAHHLWWSRGLDLPRGMGMPEGMRSSERDAHTRGVPGPSGSQTMERQRTKRGQRLQEDLSIRAMSARALEIRCQRLPHGAEQGEQRVDARLASHDVQGALLPEESFFVQRTS